jgi:hypothetical protein
LGRGGIGTGDDFDNEEFKANGLKVGGEVFWQAWHAEECVVGLFSDSISSHIATDRDSAALARGRSYRVVSQGAHV